MQNPSVVLYGAKNAQLEDKPIPELLDPHDVLVRIAYVGVCGSDVSIPIPLPCHAHQTNPRIYTSRSTSGTTAASANS
jgi:NADPH:quinone reductase-like Zn-dependent oxidoreductase